MRYKFIEKYKNLWPIVLICKVLRVSKSGFYAWRRRPKNTKNDKLLDEIKKAFQASRRTYGVPRIYKVLKAKGIIVSKNKVEKLMKLHNITPQTKKKATCTTDSNHSNKVSKNLLNREFKASKPNEKWVSDITYIHTKEGWLYLAVIIDLFNREVVGWHMNDSIDKSLVIKALTMALKKGNIPSTLLFHSHLGSQYASNEFQQLLKKHNIVSSMSRKANCLDNSVSESFFATIKKELIYKNIYSSRSQAKSDIFEYIEIFFNRLRLHSYCNFMPPCYYKKQVFGSL